MTPFTAATLKLFIIEFELPPLLKGLCHQPESLHVRDRHPGMVKRQSLGQCSHVHAHLSLQYLRKLHEGR